VEEETDVAEEAVRGSVDGRRRGARLGSTVLAVLVCLSLFGESGHGITWETSVVAVA
jgi:hypothetical protein